MGKKTQADYTDDFREQIVKLVIAGKSSTWVSGEYGIAKSTVSTWVKKYKATGSFRDVDNRSNEENELIVLRKENKRLKMEVDLLKQAALIMARK